MNSQNRTNNNKNKWPEAEGKSRVEPSVEQAHLLGRTVLTCTFIIIHLNITVHIFYIFIIIIIIIIKCMIQYVHICVEKSFFEEKIVGKCHFSYL